MSSGFAFKGVHSSRFGIVYRPESRMLMPTARRNVIAVPGRSGVYTQTYGDYDERVESFACGFVRRGTTLPATTARQIAGWLSGTGKLVFDEEPHLFYMATIIDAPPLSLHRNYAEFTITYTANPPFAMSEEKTVTLDETGISYPATVKTPTLLKIRNDNASSISNVHIIIRRLTE
jgi:phage-related protein